LGRGRRDRGFPVPAPGKVRFLAFFSRTDLEAVLTHEFGHFSGRDVAFGPLVYTIRLALVRTIESLQGQKNFLHLPFRWYGNLFLFLTNAISRRQELAADKAAVLAVGSGQFVSFHERLSDLTARFQAYWQLEYSPVLAAALAPPLIDGFETYLSRTEPAKANPEPGGKRPRYYDTHPSDAERIAQARALNVPDPVADDRPASGLFGGNEELEREFFGIERAKGFLAVTPIRWEEVGDRFLKKSYLERAKKYRSALNLDSSLARFAANVHNERLFPRPKLRGPARGRSADELRRRMATAVVGTMIAATLLSSGWSAATLPGESVVFRKDGLEFRPFDLLDKLARRELPEEEWEAECRRAGVGELNMKVLAEI
jgi:hypothetical protein